MLDCNVFGLGVLVGFIILAVLEARKGLRRRDGGKGGAGRVARCRGRAGGAVVCVPAGAGAGRGAVGGGAGVGAAASRDGASVAAPGGADSGEPSWWADLATEDREDAEREEAVRLGWVPARNWRPD